MLLYCSVKIDVLFYYTKAVLTIWPENGKYNWFYLYFDDLFSSYLIAKVRNMCSITWLCEQQNRLYNLCFDLFFLQIWTYAVPYDIEI